MKIRSVPALVALALLLVPAHAQEGARRELAEIRLAVAADRKFPEARERLQALRASLEPRAADPEANELLQRVDRLLGEVLRALGLAAPAVPSTENQDKVDQAVQVAIETGNADFLRQLGKRAVPGLVAAVREDPDTLPYLGKDAFFFLAAIDPLAASSLAGESIDQAGFFWKKRVMRTIDQTDLFQRPDVWTVGTPQRFLADGLLKTLEKYVADPDIGNEVLGELQPFVPHALTPALREALAAALRSEDPVRRTTAKGVASAVDSLRPLFEELLREGDPDLRAFAALRLSNFADASVLLDRAGDPEPKVRQQVATWLSKYESKWDARARAALARLVLDADPSVQTGALTILERMPALERSFQAPADDLIEPNNPVSARRDVHAQPLPAEIYRSLVEAKDRDVRQRLAGIASHLPGPLALELLARLARDPDQEVAESSLSYGLLRDMCFEDPAGALGVFTGLLENPALPRSRTLGNLRSRFTDLARTRSGLAAFLRWALSRNEDDLVGAIGLSSSQIQSLPPDLVREYAARLFRLGPNIVWQFLSPRMRLLSPEQARAFRPLAADPEQHAVLRLLAAGAYLQQGLPDEAWMEDARAIFMDPFWRGAPGEPWAWVPSVVEEIFRILPSDQRNELVFQVVGDPTLWVEFFTKAIEEFDPAGLRAAEITKTILERWFEPSESSAEQVSLVQVVAEAFHAMGRNPTLADRELLVRTIRGGRYEYARAALQAIGRMRDPSYLSVLEQALVESNDSAVQTWAAEALMEYLSEDAAELLLLAAAKTQNAELRDKCLAHLEKIREYQDAKERWATRKAKAQTREQVIAELVRLLDAKDTAKRVAAIRGLATWEAVEAMPRLIQLLSEKEVAAAAREALDRLNQPPSEK